MRSPIPGTGERDQDQRKDQGQLRQRIQFVNDAVPFDVEGKSFMHGRIINDKNRV